MTFLLKITEGACKGAEIALVPGVRVKLGSSDECDIMLPDATLPPVVCELDVTDTAVTVIAPDGTATALRPFFIHNCGAISFAIGPDGAPWEELRQSEPVQEPQTTEESAESTSESEEGAVEEPVAEETPSEAEPAAQNVEDTEEKKSHGVLLCILVLLLLIVAIIVYLWFWTPACLQNHKAQLSGKLGMKVPVIHQSAGTEEQTLPLDEVATQNNLQLKEENGRKVLYGNCKRRTEAQAIRALAMAADRTVKLDLTDDETLRTSTDALLYTVCEGKLTAVEVADRKVKLVGKLDDEAELKCVLDAFKNDLPAIEKIDVSGVSFETQDEDGELATVSAQESSETRPISKNNENATGDKGTASELSAKKLAQKRDYPVAGILSAPYPCVVLRNGVRCVKGAMIDNAVIVEIKPDRLVLRENGKTFEWIP